MLVRAGYMYNGKQTIFFSLENIVFHMSVDAAIYIYFQYEPPQSTENNLES